jgi:FKBP-type peptidyl-prolyl cis-trans isomerase (trigger factor)
VAEGKTLESLGEEFSTDVSEEFTEDEEEKRRSVVDSFFKSNDIRLENYIDDYESIDKVGQSRITEQADLALKTRRVIKQVAGKAKREYEDDELSEKWMRKAEEMHELAKNHRDCAGLYRDDLENRENPTLKELVDKSTTMDTPKDSLRRVMYDIGDLLMEYTDWFFEGTEITTEGTTGDSESVEGA